MIVGLPAPDTTADQLLDCTRKEADRVGKKLAVAELAAANRIVLGVWGLTARSVIFELRDDAFVGAPDVEILVVLDGDDELLWFNHESTRHDCWGYPGAEDISDDKGRPNVGVDQQVIDEIREHLCAAYVAAEGLTHGLETSDNEYFDVQLNHILRFDTEDATSAYRMALETLFT